MSHVEEPMVTSDEGLITVVIDSPPKQVKPTVDIGEFNPILDLAKNVKPAGPKKLKTSACLKRHPGKYCASRSVNHDVSRYDSGRFQYQCPHCNAYLLKSEFKNRNLSKCCDFGKVNLEDEFTRLQNPPPELFAMCTESYAHREEFLSNSRKYNVEFAFASVQTKRQIPPPRGPQVCILNGETSYEVSDLYPGEGRSPIFAQVYALDAKSAMKERQQHANEKKLSKNVMAKLEKILRRDNKLAQVYHWAAELRQKTLQECAERNEPIPKFNLYLLTNREARESHIADPHIHPHLTETPTVDQVAVMWINEEGEPPKHAGICLTFRKGGREHLHSNNPNLDPLCFPLLYPYGNQGYRLGIPMRKGSKKAHAGDDSDASDTEFGSDEENVSNTAILGKNSDRRKGSRKYVSERQYYRYLMQMRPATLCDGKPFHWLWNKRGLAEFYIITVLNKIDRHRMDHIYRVQKNLRSVLPDELIKALTKGLKEGETLGKVFFLPVTYPGSPRNMQMHYADTMATAREFGNPQLFFTFTGNPKWPEIQSELLPGQNYTHRPDIVCRVFWDKSCHVIKAIKEEQIFGPCKSFVFSVEHQKRGMPHIHMLITLEPNEIHKTAAFVDDYISAEIPPLPDANDHSPEAVKARRLHHLVTTLNLHDCNAESPCQVDGKCTKYFPKRFSPTTVLKADSFPDYRRRPPPPDGPATQFGDDDEYGNVFEKKKGGATILLDNSRVVAYSPYIMETYETHHNMEYMMFPGNETYVFKYVLKGRDRAYIRLTGEKTVDYNEIETMFVVTYITSMESDWRLNSRPIVGKTHHVGKVWVYSPSGANIVMQEGYEHEAMEKAIGERKHNMLEAFFELCKHDEFAKNLTYDQVAKFFHFDKFNGEWIRRKRNQEVVRVGNVCPSNRQLICLRILLFNVPGPTSYESLKTVDGIVYDSFEQAAERRGLLETDEMWHRTISDANVEQMSRRMFRRFFAQVLYHCSPAAPSKLFKDFLNALVPGPETTALVREQRALRYLEYYFNTWNTSCEKMGLPSPNEYNFTEIEAEENRPYVTCDAGGDEIMDKKSWASFVEKNYSKFNEKQKQIFDKVIRAVEANSDGSCHSEEKKLFFVEGAGGTGKTFLYNTLIGWALSTGRTYLATASTGIAALLLTGGSTVHSSFAVPNDVNEKTMPGLTWEGRLAQKHRAASFLIIDEVSMLGKPVFEFVHRSLQSIQERTEQPKPFGGKVVLIGGDFKQLMPVVSHGGCLDQLANSIQRSPLFPLFERLKLEQNMRVHPAELAFADLLIKIGNGQNFVSETSNFVELPPQIFVQTTEQLIEFCFPTNVLNNPLNSFLQLKDSIILAPTNVIVDRINKTILNQIPGTARIYTSIDELKVRGRDDYFTAGLEINISAQMLENIHLRTPSGFPPHGLELKIGAVVILLRNLCITDGLCNGTRLQIVKMGEDLLHCRRLSGRIGQIQNQPLVLIHRVKFEFGTEQNSREVPWTRVQFPVRLSFGLSINKAQGQTLEKVGLFLESQVFSHGHLYVAMSRVRKLSSIRIKSNNNSTKILNIVLKEALV